MQGRLIDLIQHSDIIALGTADNVRTLDARQVDTDLRVEDTLVGTLKERTLTFRGPNGIAAGERYVVFLRRTATGFESIQPSGTIFPSRPQDDEGYRRAIQSISHALRADTGAQVTAVRAVLITALAASAQPLRYHAALELAALVRDGHAPTEAEQQRLTALIASPTLDPTLRPLLTAITSASKP